MASSSNTKSIEIELKPSDAASHFGRLHIPKRLVQRIVQQLDSNERFKFNDGMAVTIILADRDIGDIGDMYELKLLREFLIGGLDRVIIHGGWDKVIKDKKLKTKDHLQLEYVNGVLYMKILRKSEQDSTMASSSFERRIQKILTDSDVNLELDQLSLPKVYILSHIVPHLSDEANKMFNECEFVDMSVYMDMKFADIYDLKLSIHGLHGGWGVIVEKWKLKAGDHLQVDYGSRGDYILMSSVDHEPTRL